MRAYVLDPTLEAQSGHHEHFAAHVLLELGAHGCEVKLYGRRRAKPTAALPVKPLFRLSHYDHSTAYAADPYIGMLVDLLASARLFAREVSLLAAEAPDDDDLIILPTAGPREMLGLALWCRKTGRRPRVMALFHRIFPAQADLSPGSLAGAVYRHAGRNVKPLAARWLVAATTRRLASRITGPLDIPVEVLPVPIWYGERRKRATSGHQGEPVIAFLGEMRPEKGYGVIPSAIRQLHARKARAKFLVHVGVPHRAVDMTAYRALEEEGLAQVVAGWVSEERIQDLFDDASLIALPYDAAQYRESVSGIFAMAVASGRPCIVPAETWMSEQVDAGSAAGLSYPPGGLVDTLCRGMDQVDALCDRADTLAPGWRMRESGPALVSRVLSWVKDPTRT